jgi:hypothetical protein
MIIFIEARRPTTKLPRAVILCKADFLANEPEN